MALSYFCCDQPVIIELDFNDKEMIDTAWINNLAINKDAQLSCFFGLNTSITATVKFLPTVDYDKACAYLDNALAQLPPEFEIERQTVEQVEFRAIPSWLLRTVKVRKHINHTPTIDFFNADTEKRLVNAGPPTGVAATRFAADLIQYAHECHAQLWYLATDSCYLYFPDSEFQVGRI